jgi:pSer/pThr/pTyr-binding forkhead associated (FHA) protein
MKVRYVLQKVNQNGSTESSTSEFELQELLIGRGGNSNITLSGRTVSLVHARILFQSGKLFIEDRNSLTGIRLNRRRVARAELGKGDEFQIGSTKFQITALAGEEIELTRKAEEQQSSSEDEVVSAQLRALDIKKYLPSIGVLSVILFLGVASAYFVLPLLGRNAESWSSGPISNNHKIIEADCESCHSTSFVQVEDKDCIKCHSMTEHSKDLKKLVADRPEHNLRCAQCHLEHNGEGALVQTDPRVCANCHVNMKNLKSDSKLLNIPSFDEHPQFRVDVKSLTDASVTRVSLDEKDKLLDNTQIKLNHALHLKAGLRGKDGPVTLQCSSCHKLDSELRTMLPIEFESHCRDCHTLGFDQRIPDVQVPHGDDEVVYPALFTEYTKLLLLRGGIDKPVTGSTDSFERVIPGGTSGVQKSEESGGSDVKAVVKQARAAEKELFTKTACYLCHTSSEKPQNEQTAANAHYRVVKPEIPSKWMHKAIFSHGAHEEVSCESCHDGVRTSSNTKDVLMPKIKDCVVCHSQEVKQGFVKSDCTMCHSYHDSLGFPPEKKKSIADYISLIRR